MERIFYAPHEITSDLENDILSPLLWHMPVYWKKWSYTNHRINWKLHSIVLLIYPLFTYSRQELNITKKDKFYIQNLHTCARKLERLFQVIFLPVILLLAVLCRGWCPRHDGTQFNLDKWGHSVCLLSLKPPQACDSVYCLLTTCPHRFCFSLEY